MHTSLRMGAVALLIAATTSPRLGAQATDRSVPETYAITNARIVPGTGATIARGTVVIRNGLIAAVGANVAAPADARVVDGTGLTVYPGFVDAFGTLGIPAPAPANGGGRGAAAAAAAAPASGPADPLAGTDADHPMGITPGVQAVDLMRVGEHTFNGARSAGITTALTAPAEGYLTGRAALVDLSDAALDDAVLKAPAAMTMQFGRGQGFGGRGYPSSIMGVFAAFRQEMLDAQRYGTWQAMYDNNPRGLQRPPMDAGLEALQPVLRREMPIIFVANSAREIDRAIGLAKEFKLKAIIAGGEEADQCIAELKAANIPVLLSLNFPHRTAPANGAVAADAEPEPLSVLESRVNAPKVAGRLAAGGVTFAFQSGGMTNWNDFLENAGKAVAAGLSADDAVRALTTAPAMVFGVQAQIGSIEPGKIANLTVTRGEVFEAGSKIDRVFVDGAMIVPETAPMGNGRGGRGQR